MNWDVFWEGIDYLLRIGGATGLLMLLCQSWIKGWVSDRFATKQELRQNEREVLRQMDGAKISVRSVVISKLVDERFRHVRALNESAHGVTNGITAATAALRTSVSFRPATRTPAEEEHLLQREQESEAMMYNAFSAFNDALAFAEAYVPDPLIAASRSFMETAGTLADKLNRETCFDEEIRRPLIEASVRLSSETRAAIEGALEMSKHVQLEA